MSAGSSTSCGAVAVIALLCLAARTVSGSTDASQSADLFGISLIIHSDAPPRTVVRFPQLPSTISSAAASASLPPAPAAEASAAPAVAALAVMYSNGSAAAGDAALSAAAESTAASATAPAVPGSATSAAGAAGSYTVTATTLVTSNQQGLQESLQVWF
ncbi:hypothetical protein COO60DRAFT_540814 [Scenedesmus sp. NREL 46B-D3]|nr:hypothetical protein COO60DRAFT_540814 [Scenedesmus sp. NREL 46B-D3]